MELVGIIALAIIVVAGVVFLWRSTPSEATREANSEDDRTKDVMVDVSPPGGVGGGGGN
jgi:hypothetical protein